MRKAKDTQGRFYFRPSKLGITTKFYDRYERISRILDENPRVLQLVHRDLEEALEPEEKEQDRECDFTSENVLRCVICQILERESLRYIVVRIDDSNYLRYFVRIHDESMMDFSTLCRLKNRRPGRR
ncbi:MAG: transposase [Planctomycetota bacterium]